MTAAAIVLLGVAGIISAANVFFVERRVHKLERQRSHDTGVA